MMRRAARRSTRRSSLVLVGWLAAACGPGLPDPREGFSSAELGDEVADASATTTSESSGDASTSDAESSESTTSESSDTTSESDTTSDETGEPACTIVDELAGALPIVREGSTLAAANELGDDTLCGGGAAGERAFVFTAPDAGLYRIDTIGSDFDTVLDVYAGTCGRELLACNNDTEGPLSWVALELLAGQTITIAVDGWFGAAGNFVVTLDRFGPSAAECPLADLGGPLPLALSDELRGGNDFFGACGGELGRDRSYRFTAPTSGLYGFDTIGSSVDTTLALRSACAGAELTCNDDIDWFTSASRVTRELAAGQSVIVVVDAQQAEPGEFVLHVDLLGCADEQAPSSTTWATSGTTLAGVNRLASGCGGSQAPEWIVEWTAPAAGIYALSSVGSDFDTVLHARAATCAAPVLTCNDDLGGSLASQLEVAAAQGDTLLLALDGRGGDAGNFALSLEPACDPFADDCAAGEVCARIGSSFVCRPADDLPLGGDCRFGTCGEGLVCASDLVLPCGNPCCAPLCDMSAPLCGVGQSCHRVLDLPGDPAWRALVGFCG